MSIQSVMPSNHLILCHPLFLLPSIFPSIGVFSISQLFVSGDQSIGASACPSNEYSGLISFRIDWFDLLAVQGTLKSLLQDHSLKASILKCSAFFMVQLWRMLPLLLFSCVKWLQLSKPQFPHLENEGLTPNCSYCQDSLR